MTSSGCGEVVLFVLAGRLLCAVCSEGGDPGQNSGSGGLGEG